MIPMEVDVEELDFDHVENIEESLNELLNSSDFEEEWEDEDEDDGGGRFLEDQDKETRFFNCHVCGDNWLSIKEVDREGACQLVFIHQMGATPILKRIATMQTPVVVTEQTVASWEYFLDESLVQEEEWRGQLEHRRRILKSICTN
jgi:hypothetical protein